MLSDPGTSQKLLRIISTRGKAPDGLRASVVKLYAGAGAANGAGCADPDPDTIVLAWTNAAHRNSPVQENSLRYADATAGSRLRAHDNN